MKWLERVSNIAVIVVAAAVVFSLAFRHRATESNDYIRQLEDRLRASTITNSQAIPHDAIPNCLIALSTSCPFCERNASLYRSLSAERASGKFRLIAVFPQPQDQAIAYLRSHQIVADQVLSLSLKELGVQATPTVLLIGQQGRTVGAWVGELNASRQKEVFDYLSKSVNQ